MFSEYEKSSRTIVKVDLEKILFILPPLVLHPLFIPGDKEFRMSAFVARMRQQAYQPKNRRTGLQFPTLRQQKRQ